MYVFHRLGIVAVLAIAPFLAPGSAHADMMDMTGVEPWHLCGSCHGVDGAGNGVKFPRIAGLAPEYLVKQLHDFLSGKRTNDGGQMEATVTEIAEADFQRTAEWFAKQTPVWPTRTLEADAEAPRIRQLALEGVGGKQACISCHHAYPTALDDPPMPVSRIAGQRDFYIAKQLRDFRNGDRDNESGSAMRDIAKTLSDDDIAGLAVFFSQNPGLHERAP